MWSRIVDAMPIKVTSNNSVGLEKVQMFYHVLMNVVLGDVLKMVQDNLSDLSTDPDNRVWLHPK
jgi:hypothetical protein